MPDFLADLDSRPLTLPSVRAITPDSLFVGEGQQGLEVAVVTARSKPADGALQSAWEARRARRATPVLLVALYGQFAAGFYPDDDTPMISEFGTCLRLIECESDEVRAVPDELSEVVYDFWEAAQRSIWEAWMLETDPVNLQPKVRPLNQRVAEFIRANPPIDQEADKTSRALDILESPWPRRDENLLRMWFDTEESAGAEKCGYLIEKILSTGIELYIQAPLLPPIQMDDIKLVCWMAVTPKLSDEAA